MCTSNTLGYRDNLLFGVGAQGWSNCVKIIFGEANGDQVPVATQIQDVDRSDCEIRHGN